MAGARRSVAEETSPAWMKDVVREPGWPVSAAGTDTRCTLTARFAGGTTSKGMGSDTISAPRGILTDAPPENARARSLDCSSTSRIG